MNVTDPTSTNPSSNPFDWVHPYHHPGGDRPMLYKQTMHAATSEEAQEGRVVRPSRRRSRASRRAPTTLLNTDTTNFRAMVQQFTGIPTAPYRATTTYHHDFPGGSPVINFGLGFNDQITSLTSATATAPAPEQDFGNMQQTHMAYQAEMLFSDSVLQGFAGGDNGDGFLFEAVHGGEREDEYLL